MPAQVFLNKYECENCRCAWDDEWCAQCDDECPECGASVSPYESTPTGAWCAHEDCEPFEGVPYPPQERKDDDNVVEEDE